MNTPKGPQTIFAEALRLPPEERAAYLAETTKDNPELQQEVESLLQSYTAGEFLEQAAVSELRTPPRTTPMTERPGDVIGRYKLLQEIGQGGCGVVYMAEQLEPVRRRVALKIIKLGMDTKSVIARFEAERQALALMDHPNIAKVLDAGATETGRPYFVMELVRGTKITEFCDERRLSTRERLDLFIQVCHAIQHAHQKGIIHRDIKPSNILVSEDDGVVVPKVIDFGISKATGGQLLTDKTVFTAFEQFLGTPAYMSPEQALITNADIDTRSDIYALGVLLYELLTGKTPFDTQELLAIGLDEMRRTIRETEPPRPSTRLSTLPGQELSTTAQRRGLEAPKLISEVRGDLDWVIMKALEKDRARRYETANGLAMDIQRHFNNEPVIACPPGWLYRFRKLVRRNKLAFAAGSVVAVSLALGLGFSTVLFLRERDARNRADEQAAIAKAVNEFLQHDLLSQASGEVQADAGYEPDPNLTVREAVERAAKRIGDRFKDQPSLEGAVRYSIGCALRLLGKAEEAIPHLERAVELSRASYGPEHRDTFRSMDQLAIAYLLAGKNDQALPLLEETFKFAKAKLGPADPRTLNVMHTLALAYQKAGNLDDALSLCEEALALSQASPEPDERVILKLMINLGTVYSAAGKNDQARTLEEEALKRSKATLRPDDPLTQLATHNLGVAYLNTGELDLALPLLEEALKLAQTTLAPSHPDTLLYMSNLIKAYGRTGKQNQALPLLEQRFKLQQEKLGPDHPDTLNSLGRLIQGFLGARNYGEAENWGRQLSARLLRRQDPPLAASAPALRVLVDLGKSLLERQQWATAEELMREYVAICEKADPDGWATFNARSMLGGSLLGQKKYAKAESLLLAGYEGMLEREEQIPPQGRPRITETVQRLVQLYEDTDRPESAAEWKQRLAEWEQKLAKFKAAARLGDLAFEHAIRGEWAEAARTFRAIKDDDAGALWLNSSFDDIEDTAFALFYAPTLIEAGDKSRYEEFRRAEIERCRDTQNPVVAERVCKESLLLPANEQLLSALSPFYDLAARPRNGSARIHGCLGLRLAGDGGLPSGRLRQVG